MSETKMIDIPVADVERYVALINNIERALCPEKAGKKRDRHVATWIVALAFHLERADAIFMPDIMEAARRIAKEHLDREKLEPILEKVRASVKRREERKKREASATPTPTREEPKP